MLIDRVQKGPIPQARPNIPRLRQRQGTELPYADEPQNNRLYGDLRAERTKLPLINGPRGVIAHLLCFDAYPSYVDVQILKLPSNEELLKLNPIQRDYLSLMLYSIRKMVAGDVIRPNVAWKFFDEEWKKSKGVTEQTFLEKRKEFFDYLKETINSTLKPLEFEFYCLAGHAGLAKYEYYEAWRSNLKIQKASCLAVEETYARILWAAMREVEGEYEMPSLSTDIKYFEIGTDAMFHNTRSTIRASINLFDEIRDNYVMLGSLLNSEIGHWLLGSVNDVVDGWILELFDRMWTVGFTRRVFHDVFNGGNSLAAMVAKQGGYYIQALGQEFPSFPQNSPFHGQTIFEEHETAEIIERNIRSSIFRAVDLGKITWEEAYQYYRAVPLYLCYFALAGEAQKQVLGRLTNLDYKVLYEYANKLGRQALEKLQDPLTESRKQELLEQRSFAFPVFNLQFPA